MLLLPPNRIIYFLPAMSDNNPESSNDSSNDSRPFVDVVQLESQLQSEGSLSKDEEEDLSSEHCQSWVYWHLFVLPGIMREIESGGKKKEDVDFHDFDRFIPKTKLGRQLGVLQYVLREEGRLLIEELLCIDVALNRIRSFSPHMVGIDHYDEMGVLQLYHGLRRFIDEFFLLSPKQRRKVLADFESAGHFSYEIMKLINRLENLTDIPRAKRKSAKTLSQGKPDRIWPDGLADRDLELFKLLSGIESISPRNQALSVLNYILPDEPASDAPREDASAPIQFEPGDKERIERLLKRFPSLKNRYPYLLKMVEKGIPAEKYNADSNHQGFFSSSSLPLNFYIPSILVDPPAEPDVQKGVSNGLMKWWVIIAVIGALIKMATILFNAWVK